MRVRELIARLRGAPLDANVVFVLPSQLLERASEISVSVAPQQPWICELFRADDGSASHIYYPSMRAARRGFSDWTENWWHENVMLLCSTPLDEEVFDLVSNDRQSKRDSGYGTINHEDVLAMRERVTRARRQQLATGDLLTREQLRVRLQVTNKGLSTLISAESIFAFDLDGEDVFPSLFSDKRLNLQRLYRIAKIIASAPPESRLDFLTARSGALGGRAPLELLADDVDYKELRRFASGWASEYSRTSVSFFAGEQVSVPLDAAPIYITVVEVDPRASIWKRALNALTSPGHRKPHEAPIAPSAFVAVIERVTLGHSGKELEAVARCRLDEGRIHVSIERRVQKDVETMTLVVPLEGTTVSDAAEQVFRALSK